MHPIPLLPSPSVVHGATAAARHGTSRTPPRPLRAALAVAALLLTGSSFSVEAQTVHTSGPWAINGGSAAPLRGVVRVSAGSGHSCAGLAGGAMRCWGDNVYGQLGDGSSDERWVAVAVIGLGSGVQSIATGGSHSCAVAHGAARCWAYNYFGQVGDGSDSDRDLPTPVSGLSSGVAATSTGMNHSCALTTGGGVRCWGNNDFGQLGDNSSNGRLTPVNVVGLTSGVQAISAGRFHTCAVMTTGAVKCWGNNEDGQLGDGTTSDRYTPVDVANFASGGRFAAAGHSHTCASTTGGSVRCWGNNSWGQLGNGGFTSSLVPVAVSGLASGVQAIDAGDSHTCAASSDGMARCWGENAFGQLGDNTWSNRNTPVIVLQDEAIFRGRFE